MFGDLKKILGIEGVKLDLIIDKKYQKSSRTIDGKIKITSLRDSVLERIDVRLIEKYQRGRNEKKLIDEYTIGKISLNTAIKVNKDDILEIPFSMTFRIQESEMDRLQSGNFFFGGVVAIAKKLKGVKSEFRLEAEGFIKGTKLQPLAIKPIVLE